MKKQRNPQEKKILSYERDRRNCYGESPHAARKAIPLHKALRNRANRHFQNQKLTLPAQTLDQDMADAIESWIYHRAPHSWNKFPDAPLREVVKKNLKKREVMRTQGRKRKIL